ncbi:hypothetical protein AB3U99_13025 [Niallia sp. JL1B1071]|uniref:hypothetical protein n=1 Tax=Niallia tiangongensis TaxID=3237105 RepID=UPI0037DDB41F
MKTTMNLVNKEKIQQILKDMVDHAYENIKGEEVLLCMECCDVDLYVAADSYEPFIEAIKENFELDDLGEIADREAYHLLMRELDEYYVDLHVKSGYYDYFPAGIYKVNGREEESESNILAPKGVFYAPFEEAIID